MAGDAYFPNDDLIQINAVIKYIDPIEREHTPISVFMDHIDHAIDVAGADHVGIGSTTAIRPRSISRTSPSSGT